MLSYSASLQGLQYGRDTDGKNQQFLDHKEDKNHKSIYL